VSLTWRRGNVTLRHRRKNARPTATSKPLSRGCPRDEHQVVDRVTPVEAIGSLTAQLSSTAAAPTSAELGEIVASPATTLFVARSDNNIVGMFTLLLFRIPTGLRAIFEDLVVLPSHRRRGVGEQLMRAALGRARLAGARTVGFTSRLSRETAHRLSASDSQCRIRKCTAICPIGTI
jgi:GNAT superfamily N-acetyltransferase